jgi:hypothetical protein
VPECLVTHQIALGMHAGVATNDGASRRQLPCKHGPPEKNLLCVGPGYAAEPGLNDDHASSRVVSRNGARRPSRPNIAQLQPIAWWKFLGRRTHRA